MLICISIRPVPRGRNSLRDYIIPLPFSVPQATCTHVQQCTTDTRQTAGRVGACGELCVANRRKKVPLIAAAPMAKETKQDICAYRTALEPAKLHNETGRASWVQNRGQINMASGLGESGKRRHIHRGNDGKLQQTRFRVAATGKAGKAVRRIYITTEAFALAKALKLVFIFQFCLFVVAAATTVALAGGGR